MFEFFMLALAVILSVALYVVIKAYAEWTVLKAIGANTPELNHTPSQTADGEAAKSYDGWREYDQ